MTASQDPVVQIADKLVDRAHVLTLLAKGTVWASGNVGGSLETFSWLKDDIARLIEDLESLYGIDHEGHP